MPDNVIALPKVALRPSKAMRQVLLSALLAFVVGAGLVTWLAWRGSLGFIADHRAARLTADSGTSTPGPAASAPADQQAVGAVETRLAMVERRLAQIDLQATAASGNATRAEGLLIAFAARRLIDKGAPLGYIGDQLKLRFGDSKPNAVQSVIEASNKPVTLDQLAGELTALGPAAAGADRDEGTWARMRRELGGLFVIHRDSPSVDLPANRIDHAKLLLVAGKIDDAIAEVQNLPQAAGMAEWVASAQRYQNVQQALDVIETAAMLDPRDLKDAQGRRVQQPSPLAPPGR
jgi:hypothetical protein